MFETGNFVNTHITFLGTHQHQLHAEHDRLTHVFLYNDVELGQHYNGGGEEDGHDTIEDL